MSAPVTKPVANVRPEPAVCPLPGPDQRPGSDVLIFDGQCSFCTAQVQRLARWDRTDRLSFLSLHDPLVAARYPDLSHDELMEKMYIVDRRGQRHGGAAAFRYLSRYLRPLWPLAPLLHIPLSLPLWQWLYRQFARRRYWFGRVGPTCEEGTCHLHTGRK